MYFHSKTKLRKAGILFSSFIFFIFFLIPYFLKNHINTIPLFIASICLGMSLFCPLLLEKPYKNWIKLGNFLSKVNSKVILAVFFYIIITPAALIRNLIKIFKIKKNNNKTLYQSENANPLLKTNSNEINCT